MDLANIKKALKGTGLIVRGGFNKEVESLPSMSNGQRTLALVLVGNAGSGMWPSFVASPEFVDGQDHPLDRWSRRIGTDIAGKFGGCCVYPFEGPPFHPFSRWAQLAESTASSPLKLTMHPTYGLWHAYRFALLLPHRIAFPQNEQLSLACDACSSQPCLRACPVDAFDGSRYDVKACCQYLAEFDEADCHHKGCLARLSCPEAAEFRYDEAHARFHMQAFLRAQLRGHT